MEDITERILLVEDEDKWFRLVREAALPIGAKVTRVSNYEQAIEKMSSGIDKYAVTIFDSRLGDGRSKLSRLVQCVEDHEGPKPSPIALTHFPGDVSTETKRQLVATLDKGEVISDPRKLTRKIRTAFRQNARDRGLIWWNRHVHDLPSPRTGEELIRNMPLALTRVGSGYRNQGLQIQGKLLHYWRASRVPVFDCVGYVLALHDDRVEVAMEVEAGKEVRRGFDGSRFKKAGLLFPGAVFRYQVFEEENGDVRSHFEPWKLPRKERIEYDQSVFTPFDATNQ